MKQHTRVLALAFGLGTVLAGCGGGGSGGGGGSASSSTTVTLTPDNAPQAAVAVNEAFGSAVGVGEVGTVLFTGVVTQDDSRSISVVELVRSEISRIQEVSGQLAPSLATGVVNTLDNLGCTTGGSVSVTWDDADNDSEISSGDTLTEVFSNCNEAGATLNGRLRLTNLSLTGDPSQIAPWSLEVSVSFTNLSVDLGLGSAQFNGTASLVAETSDGISINTALAADGLTFTGNDNSIELLDFMLDSSENLNSLAFTLNGSGTIQSSALNGSVTVSTIDSLTGFDITNSPTVGRFRINGANNSEITLNAFSASNVELKIDSNGDGAPEGIMLTSWNELGGL